MLLCPVCGARLLRMLEEFSITAAAKAEVRPVAGLAAYRCELGGHVVFIRKTDLPVSIARAATAAASK